MCFLVHPGTSLYILIPGSQLLVLNSVCSAPAAGAAAVSFNQTVNQINCIRYSPELNMLATSCGRTWRQGAVRRVERGEGVCTHTYNRIMSKHAGCCCTFHASPTHMHTYTHTHIEAGTKRFLRVSPLRRL